MEDFYWKHISTCCKLTESFVENHKNKLDWESISQHQKLSEPFIEKFQDYVNWNNISKFQTLSESFIEKFQNKVDWDYIFKYQKLSTEFIKKHKVSINKLKLWQYQSTEFKKQKLVGVNQYDCYEDYFIAYKAIRPDRYSFYSFQYRYLPGETYESNCDCTVNENSFGLNVGTYNFAKSFLGDKQGVIVKCKVYYEDIGRIVKNGSKVRCFKITVLE